MERSRTHETISPPKTVDAVLLVSKWIRVLHQDFSSHVPFCAKRNTLRNPLKTGSYSDHVPFCCSFFRHEWYILSEVCPHGSDHPLAEPLFLFMEKGTWFPTHWNHVAILKMFLFVQRVYVLSYELYGARLQGIENTVFYRRRSLTKRNIFLTLVPFCNRPEIIIRYFNYLWFYNGATHEI